jgi:hypothetical protein
MVGVHVFCFEVTSGTRRALPYLCNVMHRNCFRGLYGGPRVFLPGLHAYVPAHVMHASETYVPAYVMHAGEDTYGPFMRDQELAHM